MHNFFAATPKTQCWPVWLGIVFLLLHTIPAFAEEKSDTQELLKNFQIISKFYETKAAEALANSLIKNGQDITILEDIEEVTLKTLSVGLYPDKAEAETVVRHLQENNIEAYISLREKKTYRVYAGAMRDENNYWQRFEKLLALGYRRIHTETKPSTMAVFYVVRPKNEVLPIPFITPPDAPGFFLNGWNSKFTEGRFKGEFSLWGPSDARASANYFKASASATAEYKHNWSFHAGFRFEAIEQSAEQNYQYLDLQWRPTFISYRIPNHNWQAGLMNAVWDDRNRGSLSNRLNSKNLSRYRLDWDQTEKEQATPAIRWDFEQGQHKLTAIWTPVFQPAKLPRSDSIWHPFSKNRSEIRGIEADKTFGELIKKGHVSVERDYQTGGVGVRMSRQIGKRTRATTLQMARHQQPYFVLDKKIRTLLEQGQSIDQALANTTGPTFHTEQPYTGILSWEEYSDTVLMELTVLTNSPYTTKKYELKTAMAFEWHAGFVYPKTDKNTHVSFYTHGRYINTEDTMLDRNLQVYGSGLFWADSADRHWRFSLNYDIGINQFDVFLNPKITYRQAKNIDIYLSYQIFSGSDGTQGGYHTTHSILQLGWQAKF